MFLRKWCLRLKSAWSFRGRKKFCCFCLLSPMQSWRLQLRRPNWQPLLISLHILQTNTNILEHANEQKVVQRGTLQLLPKDNLEQKFAKMIHTQQESANVARHVPKQHFASFAKNYLEWHFASYANKWTRNPNPKSAAMTLQNNVPEKRTCKKLLSDKPSDTMQILHKDNPE